ncbi:MAG: DUF2480 family protein [Rhodothermales bacterium]|nr:DUF2480 family protein [Rhodothermales bacterium]
MESISGTAPIVNKVAASGIQVLDLAELAPSDIGLIDLEQFLFGGLILKEKHFRQEVREHDWEAYRDQHVGLICSVDTIVPVWAYMLISSTLEGIAASVTVGDEAAVRREAFLRAFDHYDWNRHQDRIVVVKGCGTSNVPESAFVQCMNHLQRVASKVMYGEPCSSVPLWRRPKDRA